MIQFSIPEKPPTVNQMYFNMPKRGRVKTTRYQKWISDATCDIELLKPRVEPVTTAKYGLIICLKKHASSDYSNYVKPIEDLLVNMGLTPDDKHNLLPICIGQEESGVSIAILDEQEARGLISFINKSLNTD
jgi:hypothetical protein